MLLYSMPQSLSHLIVHAVFSTKDRRPFLRSEEIRSETYGYMAGILKNLQCHPIKIGGVDDHVHILSCLSKNIAFADMIGRVKGSSSKRLTEKGVLGFAWQNGYGAFSVSESNVEAVTAYISDQAEHHRKFSYHEELRELLKRHQSLSTNVIFGNSDRHSAALSGRFARERLPRAEAHGLFCFRPSGDAKCPKSRALQGVGAKNHPKQPLT
jgi:putative transposase